MYGPLSTTAEQHRQDLIHEAEQRRLVKEARSGELSGTFYNLVRKALANRFGDRDEQPQAITPPIRANHAQIDFDSGVFSVQ